MNTLIKHESKSLTLEDNSNIALTLQNIVENYKKKYISFNDQKLIELFYKKDVCQTDLNKFLENWDIEREGGHKALMLSYFMKIHPELSYPQYIEPRLNGILKYYRFKNIKLMAHYKKICFALKSANIDILIIKGGALKHYYKDFPRIMGDIDILVPQKDYKKARDIALNLGYKYEEYKHSIDIHDPNTDENVLDIHHKLSMDSDNETLINEDFFKRSHSETVFNVDNICVPSSEDMVFILLINLYKNMKNHTSIQSILYSIIDCTYLINSKPDFDWNIVSRNAIKTQTGPKIIVAAKFLNEYIPNKIPEMSFEELSDENFLWIYNKWFLKFLQQKSHSLKFKEIFKNPCCNLIYYMKFKPMYFLYKRKIIRNNIKFTKMILEKQASIK